MVRAAKRARPRAVMYVVMSLTAFSAFASVPQTLVVSTPDERFFVELIQRRDVFSMFVPLILSLVAVVASAMLGKPRRQVDLFTAGGVAFSAVLLAVLLQWIGFETFSAFFLKLAALTIALSMTVLWKFFPSHLLHQRKLVNVLEKDPASAAASNRN